jgi:hypothetical protein
MRWRIRLIVNGCAAQQLVEDQDVIAPDPALSGACITQQDRDLYPSNPTERRSGDPDCQSRRGGVVGLELADIFRQYGPAYRQKYANQLLPSHRQAMLAIEQCRTEVLGGQVYACPECGEVQYSYHSCRNRHCPKCQNDKAQEWLEAQQDLLLPVPYFMLTFTLPAALSEIVRSNQSMLYNLLFRISAAATQHLAKDPRFVGGQIGLVGILHTWGRNLAYHPHIHYLVPAGGLAAGLGSALQTCGQWAHCLEIPGTLCFSSCDQQPPPAQTRK